MSLLSGTDLIFLLQQAESERFERKSELDPTKAEQALILVNVVASMANTAGGVILIGTKGRPIPPALHQHFDSARLDDKVNAFVEPRIQGITASILDDDFVLISVSPGQNPPYVFRREGNYQDSAGKTRSAFRRGEIRVRHSSKTESATREDLDRMFEERQRRLYEKVRMVFEAPPDSQIRIASSAEMAVRIDPNAPGAQPVYDLLTPEPFRDVQQELTGGLKAWKTSGQLLNDRQIIKAYQRRQEVNDPDVIELILRSCWEKHLPGVFWAARMAPQALVDTLRAVIAADLYPQAHAALKVASLLPRDSARPLLQLGCESKRKSVLVECRKLESVVRARTQKVSVLASKIGGGKKISYVSGAGIKDVLIGDISVDVFEEVLDAMAEGRRENKAAFKIAEVWCYGAALSTVQVSAERSELHNEV